MVAGTIVLAMVAMDNSSFLQPWLPTVATSMEIDNLPILPEFDLALIRRRNMVGLSGKLATIDGGSWPPSGKFVDKLSTTINHHQWLLVAIDDGHHGFKGLLIVNMRPSRRGQLLSPMNSSLVHELKLLITRQAQVFFQGP